MIEPLEDPWVGEPAPHFCPVCQERMDYRPSKHWTGQRYQILEHRWSCSSRTSHLERHTVELCEKAR